MSPELLRRTERDASRWHYASILWLVAAIHAGFFGVGLLSRGSAWAIAAMVAAVITCRISVRFFLRASRALDAIRHHEFPQPPAWQRVVERTRTEAEPDEAR